MKIRKLLVIPKFAGVQSLQSKLDSPFIIIMNLVTLSIVENMPIQIIGKAIWL